MSQFNRGSSLQGLDKIKIGNYSFEISGIVIIPIFGKGIS